MSNMNNMNHVNSLNGANTKSSNGRVDLMKTCGEPKTQDLFALYDKIPSHQCADFREPTLGLWDDTTLFVQACLKDPTANTPSAHKIVIRLKS